MTHRLLMSSSSASSFRHLVGTLVIISHLFMYVNFVLLIVMAYLVNYLHLSYLTPSRATSLNNHN